MVTLLRKTDIVKMMEIHVIEMMLAFKKIDKCWGGEKTKHDISDILKALFYSLKQFFN